MVKNKLSFIFKFVISFGLLLLLGWLMRKDAGEVIGILKSSNKLFIVLALIINIPISIGMAYRLKILLCGKKIMFSMKDAIYLTFIGYFYNNFLPTAIGGDIAKAHYASKRTSSRATSYAAVFMDRISGLIAILVIALIGLIFIGKGMDNKIIVWIVPAVFLSLVLMIAFLFKKNHIAEDIMSEEKRGLLHSIKVKFLKLYTAINLYKHDPILLIKTVALSFVLQFMSILTVYMFVLSVGGDIPLLRLFFIIPLVWTISMLPSLNGLGVREGAFVYFLKGYLGPERAFAFSVLSLGFIMLYSIAGGIFQLARPMKLRGDDADD
jgi:glycosyltransferase 2 family protein